MRGLSWPPSGPLPPGDALKASRVDTPTPRPLTVTRRSLSCPLFLTPALVVTTAARGTAAPPGGSTPDPSAQPPSLASMAATAWWSHSRWSAGAAATAGVRWYGANRNYRTHDTRPAAGVHRPHPCRAWRPDVPAPPPADGWSG